jgi:tRNA 2-thiouridine synthesizing protein A
MTDMEQMLDVRGMQCPLPLLKLKQSLNKMSPGERIRVWTTDAGSLRDFPAFLRQAGHQLVSLQEEPEQYCFVIEKR